MTAWLAKGAEPVRSPFPREFADCKKEIARAQPIRDRQALAAEATGYRRDSSSGLWNAALNREEKSRMASIFHRKN